MNAVVRTVVYQPGVFYFFLTPLLTVVFAGVLAVPVFGRWLRHAKTERERRERNTAVLEGFTLPDGTKVAGMAPRMVTVEKQMHDVSHKMDEIVVQMRPNGGSSIVDRVKRTDTTMQEVIGQFHDHLESDAAMFSNINGQLSDLLSLVGNRRKKERRKKGQQ